MAFSNLEFVKNLRSSGLTPEQSDAISKGVSELKEDMNQLTTKEDFRELKTDFKDLKTDFKDLKNEFKDLKTDFKCLKDDVKDLKNDVKAITEGINNQNSEINNLRVQIMEQRSDILEKINNSIAENQHELNTVKEQIHKGHENIRTEMHQLKNDLLTYFDRFQSDVQNRLISFSSAMFLICTGIVISVIVFLHR